jgi:hypothetical protein
MLECFFTTCVAANYCFGAGFKMLYQVQLRVETFLHIAAYIWASCVNTYAFRLVVIPALVGEVRFAVLA